MVVDVGVRSPALPHPPRRLPILGDVVGAHASTPVQDSMALAARLGPIFERVVLGRRYVLVSGADLAGELCDESRFVKHVSPAIEGLRSVGGDGLFTAYSHEPNWQKAHDLLRPAFAQSAMRGYHDIMLTVASELAAHWRSQTSVDVSSDMTKLTLDTIGRTGFSYGFDSFSRSKPHPFVDAMVGVLSHNQRREIVPIPWLANLVFKKADRRNLANQRYLEQVLDDIVRTRRDERSTPGAHADLLEIMLDAARDSGNPNALSEVNIRQQILTFLIAGHETTSGALSFALYYLANNPDVLDAARAEVDEVWGGEAPSFEQIPKLRYVRRVLDETLRLWPTAPAFAREAREDTVIGGVHEMKKGDWAFVLIPGLHRDPVWGENPEVFDPDRFVSAEVRSRPGHVYKPWGTGERACIGRQFAIHEAVLVLGTLLQQFDFHADPAYRLKVEERLTLMPKDFRLTVSIRK
ncbi:MULTISPECIES: cytochrome P450 [Nocardiaceae]|jgi:cytochrome P450|uniref:cytochrome P450 n=1 Tax=Nocardiaceae TaxID=85025 RepID=UPI00055E24E9|nr:MULTISPECIES: cytochrome P450 [Rhodococcus]OZE99323.1 cytochrome P450 [Rhodococcus sp. 15-1189-1-1a]OZF13617.1 cytochrome P450 [Rhodococcus sp. 14-2686-1-2]